MLVRPSTHSRPQRRNRWPCPPRIPAVRRVRPGLITDWHLRQLAIVYIRQSSRQQIRDHRESRERQYALVKYAVAMGWPRDRILIIDDDQGLSGKTAENRSGFHRILAEVTMEHVGLILGIEMSRLARSNMDWNHSIADVFSLRNAPGGRGRSLRSTRSQRPSPLGIKGDYE